MARKREHVGLEVGRRLLQSKLLLLNGAGRGSPPSAALSLLTGRAAIPQPPAAEGRPAPAPPTALGPRRRPDAVAAHTVYLSAEDIRDIDAIIQAWLPRAPGRLSRSAVLRQALASLRARIETGAAQDALPRHPTEDDPHG